MKPNRATGRACFLRCILLLVLIFVLGSTQSIASDREVVRFVVAGDSRGSSSGVNEPILADIVQATLQEDADFILLPGDLVYGSNVPSTLEGELLQWRSILTPLYASGIGVYPCRGNHDAGSFAAWNSVFSGEFALPGNGPPGEENVTYTFTEGGVRVIALDQYVQLNRVNQPWLDSVLLENDYPHVFVFGHAPAFKVQHYDCLDDFPAARDSFWNSLAANDVRVYFCGHDHFYDHARTNKPGDEWEDDVHQMLVGTAGAPLRDGWLYDGDNSVWTVYHHDHYEMFGYVLAEVDVASVTFTWKYRTGPGEFVASPSWSYAVYGTGCCTGDSTRGDANYDGVLNVADLTYLVDYLYLGGSRPVCPEEADVVDSDGYANIQDLTFLIDYLFRGGTTPPACP